MKNTTISEFSEYVDNLEFENIQDVSAFVRAYFEEYAKIPEEEEDNKNEAWMKYVVLTSRFGMTFVRFVESAVAAAEAFEETLENESETD